MSAYPKMVYKGPHFDDAMQLNAAVHSGVIVSIVVADEAEEHMAMDDGFGSLGDLIEPIPVIEIPQEEAPSEPAKDGE